MIALDDSRWDELGDGLFAGRLAPALVRDLSVMLERGSRSSRDWLGVWDLFHQGSFARATIAAIPHLVDLGRRHPHARREVVLVVGWLEVMGRGPTPGVELLADLRSARALARSWSLEALRGVVTDPPDLELRPHLLQAFVGLRNPRSRVASALEQLGEHLVCGRCAGRVFVDVDPVGEQGWLRVCRSADGRREEDLVEVHDVASELDERAARGRRWLGGEGDPDWPLEATLDVLAAVATEVGWGRASGALVVAAAARCPTCGAALDLAATLDLAPYTLA